jgi:hypothetical protein
MKLMKILQEVMVSNEPSFEATVKVDVDDVLSKFKDEVSDTTAKLTAKYEEELKKKLSDKIITVRASKGYGQGEKDYSFRVVDISISWYDDHYEMIFKDSKGSEYFLADGFPVEVSNKEDAPVTSAIQNTAEPSDSHLKVKNF